jgi:hypothetical protein
LQGAGREWKKAMSHARWRARLGRAVRESERAQARSLYPQSHCTTPEAETTVPGSKTTDQGSFESPDSRRQIGEALNLLVVSPVFLTPLCSAGSSQTKSSPSGILCRGLFVQNLICFSIFLLFLRVLIDCSWSAEERFEAAKLGVGASQYVFGLGWKLVQRADLRPPSLLPFLNCVT